MTNGEKIREIFPTFEFIEETEKYRTPQHQFLKVHGVNKMPYMEFDLGWWNAEYKEPKELATKSGISNKSSIYKAKESREKQIDLDKLSKLNEPTTKNDLGVECMSREEAIKYVIEWLEDEYLDTNDRTFIEIAIEALEQELTNSVLKNIKAEISDELVRMYMYRNYANGLGKAIELIDKYMTEK